MDMPEQRWLDARQAAHYTNYSVHMIRDAAAAGTLQHSRNGTYGNYRFTREQLDEWMATLTSPPRRPRTVRSA